MFNTALTLVCNPQEPVLDTAFERELGRALEDLKIKDHAFTPLSKGVALDVLFDLPGGHSAASLQQSLPAIIGDWPIDIAVQPAERRGKKLLIADMDSTIIEQECLDELADFAGLKAEISEITERAMRGELDFEDALTSRVARLKGLGEDALQRAFDERITLTPGAATLVATMKARGALTALVSGGFTFFTERVAARAGFDHQRANELIVRDGALTGEVGRPILGRDAKREALVDYANATGIGLGECLAVGDGANDLAMIEAAGLGVAFRAKPAVREAAGIAITHGDLTALLYIQGIPAADFVI